MSNAGRIPLTDWAARAFPVRTPHIQTLRRWARDGNIRPAPIKAGRQYYVAPDAEYMDTETLVRRLTDGAQAQKPG
jgi:hypothetical protein